LWVVSHPKAPPGQLGPSVVFAGRIVEARSKLMLIYCLFFLKS
jgi:hypothetical protein